jgi:hypothetical protein
MQAERKGLVMVNFFSYFLTCSNHSTLNDVIGESSLNDDFFLKQINFCLQLNSFSIRVDV